VDPAPMTWVVIDLSMGLGQYENTRWTDTAKMHSIMRRVRQHLEIDAILCQMGHGLRGDFPGSIQASLPHPSPKGCPFGLGPFWPDPTGRPFGPGPKGPHSFRDRPQAQRALGPRLALWAQPKGPGPEGK